ncbi:hypothetical protein [Bradyrhizobium centrolobii]|uniref:hypothetical protein n=1 Tax=Bradyrhizobium centrolobii TaxID=1505087 RepID=UPI0010A96D2C|nr:hypothetical protein [Bradyrhizobium centrolobii]
MANATPVLTSRAFAMTQNLSSVAAIRTIGYTVGGDGGGATFKNVGTAPFIDSFITSFTIAGGSGYTNGTYFGVIFATGSKPFTVGKVTVSGGAVASVDFTYTPGNQCAVGDVLTITGVGSGASMGAGTGASITVTACSTPLASFTDSVGTRFQFVPDTYPNILQFGAKGDWNGTDAGTTDNFSAIQAAAWFAGNKSSFQQDGGGYWGGRLNVPNGSFLMCGTGSVPFVVPQGVVIQGTTSGAGTTLKMCDSFSAASNFVEICDPNWQFACFGAMLRDITIFATRTVTANDGVALIHSNNIQDGGAIDHVYAYPGKRMCLWFQKGYGGASTVSIENFFCAINGGANQPAMILGDTVASGMNYGTTGISIKNLGVGGPSSAPFHQGPGIIFRGGFPIIENVHCENMGECVQFDIPAATGNGNIARIHNINAGSGTVTCNGVITLTGNNNAGNVIMGQIVAGSCTHTVNNGQASGVSYDSSIGQDACFNPSFTRTSCP